MSVNHLIPAFDSISEAIDYLTDCRYEDPLFVGSEVAIFKGITIKLRVEGWSPDCFSFVLQGGQLPEDLTEQIHSQWDDEERRNGFEPLENLRGFDEGCGEYGQHFAFYVRSGESRSGA